MKRIFFTGFLLGLFACGVAKGGLVGHYTFDDIFNPGADSSGYGNDATSLNDMAYTSDAVSGGGAAYFTEGSQSYLDWSGTTNPIAKVLAGSFSFLLWLKTTETFGTNTDQGYMGAGIVYAGVPGGNDDAIPMALNGGKLGFDTGYPTDSTLHSISDINTGDYVFLAVTWEQSAGLKSIYVNGNLEAQENHSAGEDLSGRNELVLGGNLTDVRYFYGEIDDFQVYNEALTSNQVAFLYNNPGQTIASPTPVQILSPQVSGTNFVFSFQTVDNQNYIVESEANLTGLNWMTNTALVGDGTVRQITVPGTNGSQFFRVSEP